MRALLFVAALVALTATNVNAELTGLICSVKTLVPGCTTCALGPITIPKMKPLFECSACGGDAYEPTYDAAAQRCPCAKGHGVDINVDLLIVAAEDPNLPADRRRALALQAVKFKVEFLGGKVGICKPCPTTDLLGNSYTAPGGVTSTCRPRL